MIAYTPAEKFLRGPLGFALVSLLHLVVIFLIANGLTRHARSPADDVAGVSLVFERDPVPVPVPVGDPDLRDPLVVDPLPDLPLVEEAEPDRVLAEPVPVEPQSPVTGTPAEEPFVAPRIDARRGLTQPEYPPAAIRQGWEGRVLLRLTVGIDGRVLAAEVLKGSGFPVLDQAAVSTALREWRLQPARRGTAAVEGDFSTWVRFSITDR